MEREHICHDGQNLGVVEDQIRDCFGRIVYTHKTHEKCADMLLARLSRIKLAQVVLSSFTTAGFISVVAGAGHLATIAGGIISVALLALNTYAKSADLGGVAHEHRQAAANLWLLREQYLSLITDLKSNRMSLDDLCRRRDSLVEEAHRVYLSTPSTSAAAYRKAQLALQVHDEMTFEVEEIDALLPSGLKKRPTIGSGDV